MKTIIYLICIIIGGYGVYSWHEAIQEEIKNDQNEIIKDISSEEIKKVFKKVSKLGENTKSQLDTIDSSVNHIQIVQKNKLIISQYEWSLVPTLPGDQKIKDTTISLLNAFKSANDIKVPIIFFQTKEVRDAIEVFNKRPDLTSKIFEYLLAQPEVKDFDGISANLFKLASYLKFDKRGVISTALEVVNSSVLDQRAVNIDEQENEYQILKICEASKLIIESKASSKEESLKYIEEALSIQKNPLVRTELLSQFGVYFPKEASILKMRFREAGEENIHEFFSRSSPEK